MVSTHYSYHINYGQLILLHYHKFISYVSQGGLISKFRVYKASIKNQAKIFLSNRSQLPVVGYVPYLKYTISMHASILRQKYEICQQPVMQCNVMQPTVIITTKESCLFRYSLFKGYTFVRPVEPFVTRIKNFDSGKFALIA